MRSFVSTVSVGLLFWMLTAAPFVHVHPAGGHDGGAMVHHHLPYESHARHADGGGPSIDEGEHDGHHIDVFSSVLSKTDPVVVFVEAAPDLTPSSAARLQGRSDDAGWKRGPPARRSSPRAPPTTFLAV